MAEVETRWPCPVCLGVTMEKLHAGDAADVVLDHCPRCGGIWFENDEVHRLRSLHRDTVWQQFRAPATTALAQCHYCHTPVGRDVHSCPACGVAPRLDCPTCDREMDVVQQGRLTLDVCTHCRGVWFDHHELAGIWELQRDAAVQRRRQHATAADGTGDVAAWVLLDSMFYAPDLVFLGAHAAGRAVAASADALGSAPGALSGAAEIAGEAAEGVFTTILEIIGGIFG